MIQQSQLDENENEKEISSSPRSSHPNVKINETLDGIIKDPVWVARWKIIARYPRARAGVSRKILYVLHWTVSRVGGISRLCFNRAWTITRPRWKCYLPSSSSSSPVIKAPIIPRHTRDTDTDGIDREYP